VYLLDISEPADAHGRGKELLSPIMTRRQLRRIGYDEFSPQKSRQANRT
jgi:hypothetical protein